MTYRRKIVRCHYCNRIMNPSDRPPFSLAVTKDHVFPKAFGGRRKVLCCFQCNNIKGCMIPDQWWHFMRRNPKWWTLDSDELREARRASFQAFPTAMTRDYA